MTNEELQKEMIAAMKAKDKVRLSIIRQVKAEVKNIEVNERRDVTEEDVNSMIKRLIKQTSETLEMSIKAGTDQERTDNLTEQVKILESLLPAQVSGEELEALIEQVIAELGATSKKQMGQVMGALGKATGGNASFYDGDSNQVTVKGGTTTALGGKAEGADGKATNGSSIKTSRNGKIGLSVETGGTFVTAMPGERDGKGNGIIGNVEIKTAGGKIEEGANATVVKKEAGCITVTGDLVGIKQDSHSYELTATVEPTCTTPGKRVYTCTTEGHKGEIYEEIIAFAHEHDLLIVHDNAYSDIVFDGEPGGSFLQYPGALEVGVEFFSLSKSFNVTGARIGFLVGREDVVSAFAKLRSQIDFGMFFPIQKAAIACLNGPRDEVEAQRLKYQERRDALCDGLEGLGWERPNAHGSMFVWAKLPGGRTDSMAFCEELMEKAGVVVTPGASFGPSGEGHVRMALVLPPDQIALAVEAIREAGLY